MMWMDPLSVTCKACGFNDSYSVKQLKELAATCNRCGKSLSYVGRTMLEEERRLSAQVQIIELLLDIEAKLDIEFHDEEIEPIENLTVNRIVELAESKKRDEKGIQGIIFDTVGTLFSSEKITRDDDGVLFRLFLDKHD